MEGTQKITIVVGFLDADAMLKRRVCSECHGQLISTADMYETDRYHVSCPACENWNGGTISKLTLEQRELKEREQYHEARINLRDILPKRDEQDILSELGV